MPGRGNGAGRSLSGSPSCSLKLSEEYEAAEKSFSVTLSNSPLPLPEVGWARDPDPCGSSNPAEPRVETTINPATECSLCAGHRRKNGAAYLKSFNPRNSPLPPLSQMRKPRCTDLKYLS